MVATATRYQYRDILQELCRKVADFQKQQLDLVSEKDIESKDLNSLVSYVDKESERMIVEALMALTPQAGFITEEDTEDSQVEALTWIIDPLDGTTNYLQKIPHFSISIALMEEGQLTLGIVYEVMIDVAYTAILGEGAWEDEKRISVSNTSLMNQAIVVTGFPYKRDEDLAASFDLLKYCIENCRGVRRLGSAALDLAYVASGKIDLYYERSLNIWDLAAGALLVSEAGGVITDYNGKGNYLQKGSLISSNSFLHSEMLKVISR